MRLAIEKSVYGGDGLGRDADGRALFVPYVLPGEVVEVEPVEGQKMRLVQVSEASVARVEPGCRHFGVCGGCQYQHARYDAQLEMKVGILGETLERAGIRDVPGILGHLGGEWGYRNRVRLRVEVVSGEVRVGYNRPESREFLAIEECPIAAPVLWRAATALMQVAKNDEVGARWLRAVAEVEVFATGDEGALQMMLVMRDGETRTSGFSEFCQQLWGFLPELVGVGAGDGVSWGKGGLRYVVDGKGYWVSRGGFFQVNRFLVDDLVRLVAGGRKGLIAWDLFAGVGLFSRALADGFGEVLAVEASATAIRDLAAAKVPNVRGLAGSVADFLRRAVVGRERPELVVMDPPRAGAGKEVCELLVRMQVPQIVYVSCDPTTLARDLRGMVDSGYDLAELHMVDLFPQTYHLETVAVLQRKPW